MSSDKSSVLKWFVIYTRPNYEKKVYISLQEKGVTSFLPLMKKNRVWSDRKKIIYAPLFPNYVFVNTASSERFKLLDIRGICSYVSFNGVPAHISQEELIIIKKMMQDPEVMLEDYVEGDLVQVLDGPFVGLVGTVFERKGKMRLCVNLRSINRALSAEFNVSSLRKIKARKELIAKETTNVLHQNDTTFL